MTCQITKTTIIIDILSNYRIVFIENFALGLTRFNNNNKNTYIYYKALLLDPCLTSLVILCYPPMAFWSNYMPSLDTGE